MPVNAVAVPFSFAFCKAYVFDEPFSVNSPFNAKIFLAPPHAVAMEFDPFGESRSPDASGLG